MLVEGSIPHHQFVDPKLQSSSSSINEVSSIQIPIPAKNQQKKKSSSKVKAILAVSLFILGMVVSLQLYFKFAAPITSNKPTNIIGGNIQLSADKQGKKEGQKGSDDKKDTKQEGKDKPIKPKNLKTDHGDDGQEPPNDSNLWNKIARDNRNAQIGIPYQKQDQVVQDETEKMSDSEENNDLDEGEQEEGDEYAFVKKMEHTSKTPIGRMRD